MAKESMPCTSSIATKRILNPRTVQDTFATKPNGEGRLTGRAHNVHCKKAFSCAFAALKCETSRPSAPYSRQAAQRCAGSDVPWLFPSRVFFVHCGFTLPELH
ncbi:hypothetical protein TRVL_05424 [Trypanosoma vivax]|nr:hypothetical protein TRVL_05424 [Trypanosoma vivax]